MTDGNRPGIFRSRDGDEVWARGPQGFLVPLPSAEREAWEPDERHRVMAAALREFGLWDHLAASGRDAAAAGVASGCYPLDFDVLFEQVEFFADGESLAEWGVERFLLGLAPTLSRYGVELRRSGRPRWSTNCSKPRGAAGSVPTPSTPAATRASCS